LFDIYVSNADWEVKPNKIKELAGERFKEKHLLTAYLSCCESYRNPQWLLKEAAIFQLVVYMNKTTSVTRDGMKVTV